MAADHSALMAMLEAKDEEPENIWIAASDGNLDAVKAYLASGVVVNAQDEHGYSCIHAAASYGHAELLTFLLANGGNPSLADCDGDTPMHACEDPECARLLVTAGADVNAKNTAGLTPLDIAIEDARSEMVPFLLTQGAVVTREYEFGAPEDDEEGGEEAAADEDMA